MKKAIGLIEILIVVVIVIALYFTCFRSNIGRVNPFDDNSTINSQQEIIDSKIQQIEDTKLLKEQIEKNLNEGY